MGSVPSPGPYAALRQEVSRAGAKGPSAVPRQEAPTAYDRPMIQNLLAAETSASPRFRLGIATLVLALTAGAATAQRTESWRAMNQPVEPFRIADNLYYVGASSVAAYLITTEAGHIVIDGGFLETVPIITSGIETLGFSLEDVAILLNSHAHIDHAGGLARLKELTGARMVASALDAPLLENGGTTDDLFGDRLAFDPVKVDRRLEDGDTVKLGGVTLTALVTAGHTRGCTSWSLDLRVDGQARKAVSVCSLSVLDGMVFEGEKATYPGLASDFRGSFAKLEASGAEIFLASHAEFFDLAGKRERMGDGANPFVDPEGLAHYVDRARERFEAALEAERNPPVPPDPPPKQ